MAGSGYQSELTKFLHQVASDDPELPNKQKHLRKTWWDHTPDNYIEQLQLMRDNLVNDEYVYFTYAKK